MKKILYLLLFVTSVSHAAWIGPEYILTLPFGEAEGSISLLHGDTEDGHAEWFDVSNDGHIIIVDEVKRIYFLYDKEGNHKHYGLNHQEF